MQQLYKMKQLSLQQTARRFTLVSFFHSSLYTVKQQLQLLIQKQFAFDNRLKEGWAFELFQNDVQAVYMGALSLEEQLCEVKLLVRGVLREIHAADPNCPTSVLAQETDREVEMVSGARGLLGCI